MIEQLGNIKAASLIAGFFGGVVFISISENRLSTLQIISSLVIGTLCAGYLTPLIAAILTTYLSVNVTEELHSGIAFLIGLSAISLIPVLLQRLKAKASGKGNDGE